MYDSEHYNISKISCQSQFRAINFVLIPKTEFTESGVIENE